ncbi:MAG: hypothetical protein R6W84_03380 [Promethearchaeia archaeon]
MESEENWKQIISKIKNIEQKYTNLHEYLSSLNIPSRDSILEEIHKNIIMDHPIFKEFGSLKDEMFIEKTNKKSKKIHNFIQTTIKNIKVNPVKKVFYLRKFLDKFIDISESDKNVVIKSLKNTGIDELNEKMESLIKIFKIEDIE